METDSRTFLRAARSRTNVPFCEVTTEGPASTATNALRKRRAGARIDDDASDCRAGGDLRGGRCGRQNHDRQIRNRVDSSVVAQPMAVGRVAAKSRQIVQTGAYRLLYGVVQAA